MDNVIKVVGFDEFAAACDLCSTKEYYVYDIYIPEDCVENYIMREVVRKDKEVSVRETLKITESDMYGMSDEKITSKGAVSFPRDKSVKLVIREKELTYEKALKGERPTIREVTYVYDPKKNVA